MIVLRSCCTFVDCTFIMWVSDSTTSQICSVGLRSGDYGCHLSTVDSMSSQRNQFEMNEALTCWKQQSDEGYSMIMKGWTWSAALAGQTVVFKWCSTATKGHKLCQENIPTTLHHYFQSESLTEARMDPCFYVVYTKLKPYHLNVTAESKTH